jgi:hypothetical protein
MRSAPFRLLVAAVLAAAGGARFIAALIQGSGFMHDYRFAFVPFATEAWAGINPFREIPISPPDRFYQGVVGAVNTPPFLAMMWPWTVLPTTAGEVLWTGLEVLAIAATLVLVYRAIGRPTTAEALVAVAVCLSIPAVTDNINQGQIALFIAAAIALALHSHQRGRPALGGIALGLAVAARVTPVFLVAYFLWKRDLRLAAWAAATTVAACLATLALGWGGYWQGFLAGLDQMGRGTANVLNQSLNGVLLRLWRPELSGMPIEAPPLGYRLLWIALAAVLVVGTIALLRGVRLPTIEREWVEVSLLLVALTAAQPYAWTNHYAQALMVVPVAVRLVARGVASIGATAVLVLTYLALVLLEFPLFSLASDAGGDGMRGRPLLALAGSVSFFAALAVIGAFFRMGRARAPWS